MKSSTYSGIGLLLSMLVSVAASAQSADRVWLEPQRPSESQSRWYPRSVSHLSGKILQLDDRQLRLIVTGDEAESLLAAGRVLWIEYGELSKDESHALRLFAEAKYGDSVRPLLDALSQRPPIWRQQWLSMLAAHAAWRSSRATIALELVSQLDQRPLAPLIIAMLPVSWYNERLSPETIDAAQARLTDPSAAVRLVAASWLIATPRRSQATAVLKQLALDNGRPTLARLAETLLWRLATPPQVLQSAEQWQQKLDALPMVLQVGPTITLAAKLRAAGKSQPAEHLEMSLTLNPPFPHPEIKALSKRIASTQQD
ncbi:MAG: hypothetical protein MI861_06850 [Pirellulales bacterium]|nr:hypothetical protein [Pirellulales bacterium]